MGDIRKNQKSEEKVHTSLELDHAIMEQNNIRFQSTYKRISENEVRFEEINCENADYLIVAFGSMSRICQKTIELAAEEGIKIGLLRPSRYGRSRRKLSLAMQIM